MYHKIKEGKATVKVPIEKKVSKELPVFYNPVMKHNRDISVLLLKSLPDKNLQISLPLAGTGVRGVRFLLELKKGKIKNISFNDLNEKAAELIKENLKLNKLKQNKKIMISNKDANEFLLESSGFDYIDIDPFGTPNPFLDNAIKRLSRNGILAVTATDTGCLAGTFKEACLRKYWALPKKDELMHETGLRILIRKIQLVAAQYGKALIPIFSYFKDHYFRVFFRAEKGKQKVDELLKQHGDFNDAGPMWLGKLWDFIIIRRMCPSASPRQKSSLIEDKELDNFLKTISLESKINAVGFYDVHKIVKKYKLKKVPKSDELIEKLKKKNYSAARTHFIKTGIRSDISLKEFIELIQSTL